MKSRNEVADKNDSGTTVHWEKPVLGKVLLGREQQSGAPFPVTVQAVSVPANQSLLAHVWGHTAISHGAQGQAAPGTNVRSPLRPGEEIVKGSAHLLI